MKWFPSIWRNMVNRRGCLKHLDKETVKCDFQTAVENTKDVRNGFRTGKQALKNVDREKVVVTDAKKLQGSLDIDTQVKELYPREPRWDYALSYNNKIYYLEIHPAETSEIDKIISKLRWLKNWLKTKAEEIDKLPKAEHPYVWVQSGRYAILPNSKAQMKLSAVGIVTGNTLKLK